MGPLEIGAVPPNELLVGPSNKLGRESITSGTLQGKKKIRKNSYISVFYVKEINCCCPLLLPGSARLSCSKGSPLFSSLPENFDLDADQAGALGLSPDRARKEGREEHSVQHRGNEAV